MKQVQSLRRMPCEAFFRTQFQKASRSQPEGNKTTWSTQEGTLPQVHAITCATWNDIGRVKAMYIAIKQGQYVD